MAFPSDLPPHDALADDEDELGWDRSLHGRMVDCATDGDEIETDMHDCHETGGDIPCRT